MILMIEMIAPRGTKESKEIPLKMKTQVQRNTKTKPDNMQRMLKINYKTSNLKVLKRWIR